MYYYSHYKFHYFSLILRMSDEIFGDVSYMPPSNKECEQFYCVSDSYARTVEANRLKRLLSGKVIPQRSPLAFQISSSSPPPSFPPSSPPSP